MTRSLEPWSSDLGHICYPNMVVHDNNVRNGLLPPQFSSAGCGLSKSCLRDPVGCHPESDPACFFLSFVTDQQGGSVTFELSGPAEGYLAFALSLDKWMVSYMIQNINSHGWILFKWGRILKHEWICTAFVKKRRSLFTFFRHPILCPFPE